MKLSLANKAESQIEDGSNLSAIGVVSDSKASMLATWDSMTADNLKSVQIQSEGGAVIGEYQNIVLDSETSVIQSDGTIRTSYHLREKTEVELLREEVEQLKETTEVHDGAIEDLGTVVNEIATGGAV